MYTIHCFRCEKDTSAESIVEIIQEHTDVAGRYLCSHCGSSHTSVRPVEKTSKANKEEVQKRE
ncbi:MAG: hypothetical protein COB67_04625 [SAR324 cluster bacterium]|uniref:Uncharacterized protein n=1 Tax=SAR324 cluster bacterium TaxID=2024889 RepID=A0A2A4T737_9DELT|nr:MAG: hypothetical protein COB67_04625 [SAR324 cluster bacterium]